MSDERMYQSVEGWLLRAGIDPLSVAEVTVRLKGGEVVGFDTTAAPGGLRFLRPVPAPLPGGDG